MPQLSDVHTERVLCGLEQISELMRDVPPQTWRQLITTGHAMHCPDADHFTLGVVLAINHDRAALLTYAWRHILEQVRLHLRLADQPHAKRTGGRPPGADPGADPSLGGNGGEEDPDHLADIAAAQLPLCATIMAMTLADLMDDQTFETLIQPTASAVGPALRTAARGHA